MKTTDYQKQATDFLNQTGATLSIVYDRYGKYFTNDKDERDIYKCVLQRGSRKYEFEFGQSTFRSGRFILGYKNRFKFRDLPKWGQLPGGYQMREVKKNPDFAEPTAYDILAGMQKYEVGSFEDFVSEFGYEITGVASYKAIETTYNAVVGEVTAVKMLFTDAEIEVLQEIN